MRLAYFITGLGLGGAEVITLDLAQKAFEAGHEVIVVYLSGLDALAGKIPSGIGVFPLSMRKTPVGLWNALGKARRIVRDFHPDIVHSNMVHSNIFTRILRLTTKFPALICSEHSKYIGGRGRMLAYRLTDGLSDLNTNVSQEAVEEFVNRKAFRKSSAMTVYNGIDTARFAPDREAGGRVREIYGIADNEFLWLNVGRLTEAKDQANLLRAFARVGHGRLLIVGAGELRVELESQIEELGLTGHAILAGVHPNVAEYYNAADGFVLSSAWEGFSVALIEAMACGLPAVTTDVSGCIEALQNPEYIVPVRQSDLLAEKMVWMASLSREQRKLIGENNRLLVAAFSLEAIFGVWENIYANVIQSHQ